MCYTTLKCVCVCVCVCVCAGVVREGYNIMTIYILFFRFLLYTFFVDLIKRGVLTLVGEIWRYRNDRF